MAEMRYQEWMEIAELLVSRETKVSKESLEMGAPLVLLESQEKLEMTVTKGQKDIQEGRVSGPLTVNQVSLVLMEPLEDPAGEVIKELQVYLDSLD